MTTNYNRKPISPADAWLCDPATGAIVGVEYGDSRQQKNFFPGVGNTVPDVMLGAVTATSVAAAFTGNLTGNVAGSAASTNSASKGTAATGVTAVEYGDGRHHVSVLTVVTTLPAIAGGADLARGKLLYTLPAGAQVLSAARMSLAIKQTQAHITADTPDVALGTVIASGAVAVLDGTATFEDIITGQTAADCDGTATAVTALPTAAVPLIFELGGTKTIHFNAAFGWAASGDAAALLTGTVVLIWDTLA